MATSAMTEVIEHLRHGALLRQADGMIDEQLLARFVQRRDEVAFEVLVRRHGPMVLGLCRRVLGDAHDAEDAFQATFLVLVRKAASLAQPELLGNWLYGVAYRTAQEAKTKGTLRRSREKQVADMPDALVEPPAVHDDRLPLLDSELNRLPAKYRVPVVLCDLEGRTRKEVARRLNLPEGTLSSRLASARKMLAKRLARRGVALAGGVLAAALAPNAASACVPASLVFATLAVTSMTGGAATAVGAVSANVAVLSERVLRAMLLTKLKIAAALLVVGTLVTASTGLLSYGLVTAGGLGSQEQPSGEPGQNAVGPDGDAAVNKPDANHEDISWVFGADQRAARPPLAPPAQRELEQLNAKVIESNWPSAIDIYERPWAYPDDRMPSPEIAAFVVAAKKRLGAMGSEVQWIPERNAYVAAFPRIAMPSNGVKESAGARLSEKIARRFTDGLKALQFPFMTEKRLTAIYREIRDFAAGYDPGGMTVAQQEKLLVAVDGYVTRHFAPYRNKPAARVEELAYLEFPDLIRNFEWLLARSLTRRPLSPAQTRVVQEQRAWLREFLDGVPVRPNDVPDGRTPEHVRQEAMDQLTQEFADPMSLLFDPMSDKQFQALKNDMKEYKAAGAGLPATVSNIPFRTLMARAGEMPPRFEDRVVSLFGYGSGGLATWFASNDAFHAKAVQLGGWRTFKAQRPVFDMIGTAVFNIPPEIAGDKPNDLAVVKWLEKDGKGEFIFDAGALQTVRGTRVAVLDARSWLEADKMSDAELRKLLAEKGTTSVSVASLRGYNGMGPHNAPRIFIALENPQKSLAVAELHHREFGGLVFGCRTRRAPDQQKVTGP